MDVLFEDGTINCCCSVGIEMVFRLFRNGRESRTRGGGNNLVSSMIEPLIFRFTKVLLAGRGGNFTFCTEP